MSAPGEATRPTRLGRYELITRIGQGGMAEVQLALQRGPAGFEKLVVVKLVHSNLASQKAFVDMLLDEARVAALVKHPNVVDIYDLGQAEGRFFIAMEYLEGEPLLAVLRAGREGKRLDPLSTGRLIADTAEGLDAAHELRSMSGERLELVHHDISLGNIVVLYNGQVKLVDFGVAKATQTAAAGKAKVQGKFSYMAPEKLKGAPGDRRSDIFSLGCVMWEALTLKRLFRGGNDGETMKQVLEAVIQPPSKVNGDVPPEYDAIVMRALDRDPDKRQSTAKEMAVEIEELLRKRGYGAKNDKVAKYMQETFRSHIDARKKLVQEVVSKGSASAEVLDAAFSDPVLASGSPVTPTQQGTDFSTKYRRVTPATGVPVVTSAWADASKPTQITTAPVHPMFDGGDGTATEIRPVPEDIAKEHENDKHAPLGKRLPPPKRTASPSPPPPTPASPPAAAAAAAAPPAPSEADAAETLVSMNDGAEDVSDIPGGPSAISRALARGKDLARTTWADKKKRPFVIGGAALLLLLIIVVVVAGGGSKSTKAEANKGSGEGSQTVAVGDGSGSSTDTAMAGSGSDTPMVGSDGSAATGSAASTGSAGSAGSAGSDEPDIEIENGSAGSAGSAVKPNPVDHSHDHQTDHQNDHQNDHNNNNIVTPPPPPPLDVPGTVNKATLAYVKGDAKGALAMLLKCKAAKPGYAPTYRVLGKVYKKLGNNAAAKQAFQKYISLAPTASDIDSIKEELNSL